MERTSPRSFILKVSYVLRIKSKILPWPTCPCGSDTWHSVQFSPPLCQERLILVLDFGLGSFLLCVSHSGVQVEGAAAPGHAISLVTTSARETKPNCIHTFKLFSSHLVHSYPLAKLTHMAKAKVIVQGHTLCSQGRGVTSIYQTVIWFDLNCLE